MTANLGVRFELVRDALAAQILIVNADDPATVHAFLGMTRRPAALFIGERDVGAQWPRLTQPLRLTKVLQALQAIAATLPTDKSADAVTLEPVAAAVPRALVIDDNDLALNSAMTQIRALGLEVDAARSGEQAMVHLLERPYAVVFIDVMMEGMDGYQTCRVVKQRKYAHGKPPVAIMLTSRGGAIDKIRGSLAGCDAYLTKPLDRNDLQKVLLKHALMPRARVFHPSRETT